MEATNPADAVPYDDPRALRRYLYRERFGDREIAEYMNDPLLYLLHKHPNAPPPLYLLDRPAPGRPCTADDVRKWRRAHGLPAHRAVRRDFRAPGKARTLARRAYAARWVGLGLDLYPAQVDALDALHAHGPHTLRQLMDRYGWRRKPVVHGNRSVLGTLVSAGAVVVLQDTPEHGRLVRLYAIAPGVQPRHDRRRLTGVEHRLRDLGLITDKPNRLQPPTCSAEFPGQENFRDN